MKKQPSLAFTPLCCAIISVLASSQALAAANFTINVAQGTTLPTIVYPGNTVRAYYTITNQTSSARNGYVIEKLTATARQNTRRNNCQAVINLPAHGSCTLEIEITGAAQLSFALCKGSSCTTASVPLNVSLATSALPMVAAGEFSMDNNPQLGLNGTFPLLAGSVDGGTSWTYPSSIISALPAEITSSYFNSASCSGNTCIAAGGMNQNSDYYPFLAQSTDGGQTWTYPPTIISALPDYFSNEDSENQFNSTSCNGTYCVAVGEDRTKWGSTVPLIAESLDSGLTWSYPATSPENDFAFFRSVSCSDGTCVAVGEDDVSETSLPLLAQRNSQGIWTYPPSIYTGSPNASNGAPVSFYGVGCSGNTCIAVGEFLNTNLSNNLVLMNEYPFVPLLAQSEDGGRNWFYPSSIIDDFANIYNNTPGNNDYSNFSSASCNQHVCIAAGYGEDSGFYPLLAQRVPGMSWNYTISNQDNFTHQPFQLILLVRGKIVTLVA